MIRRTTHWLETHACIPAYSGWVLGVIAISFFGSAINTMAGWLYVISGVSFAMLSLGAILPPRSLSGLIVKREPIQPVTAGEDLTIELEIFNQTKQSVKLLQVEDILPFILGKPVKQAIEIIPQGGSHRWVYYQSTQNRGVYRWHTVELGTGAPLGLFWCRRLREVPAKAVVYPIVLPLTHCPLIDNLGEQDSLKMDLGGRPLVATAGLTRSLRPYRIGDPMRLIHWRSSARYGELRVRDLEMMTGGQDIIIAIDTAGSWEEESFEQAVITVASLYFYAHRRQMHVQLWTPLTGLVKGDRVVKETLAATTPFEVATDVQPPRNPLIWLTQNPLTLSSLPNGSRWVMWQNVSVSQEPMILNRNHSGIIVDSKQILQPQLQREL